jgi:amidase
MTSNVFSGTLPDLYEASITELQDGLVQGLFSSVQLVKVSRHLSACLIPALL